MTRNPTSTLPLPPDAPDASRHPIAEAVEAWYGRHGRRLPWRDTADPYRIWISEIILQQTRVAQGYDYYVRFVRRFPDVFALAAASEDEVLTAWQGLGYYSRARNLHAAARSIAAAGAFPTTYEGVRALRGVGPYTAAAICSFAYGLPHAVVDGNVYRVLARHFGLSTPIDSTAGRHEFAALAEALLDRKAPALYNQALMDFGALQCTPQNPNCTACPLNGSCVARQRGSVEALPVREKRTAVRDRYFVYLYLLRPDGSLLLRRRPAGDIWQGLYEPLLLEFSSAPSETDVMGHAAWATLGPVSSVAQVVRGRLHVLTHQRLHMDGYLVRLASDAALPGFVRVEAGARDAYAVPRLVELLFEAVDAYI